MQEVINNFTFTAFEGFGKTIEEAINKELDRTPIADSWQGLRDYFSALFEDVMGKAAANAIDRVFLSNQLLVDASFGAAGQNPLALPLPTGGTKASAEAKTLERARERAFKNQKKMERALKAEIEVIRFKAVLGEAEADRLKRELKLDEAILRLDVESLKLNKEQREEWDRTIVTLRKLHGVKEDLLESDRIKDEATKIREKLEDAELKRQEDAAKRQEELLLEPFKNAIGGIQDAFTDLFNDIFDGGIRTFRDFADAIFGVFKQLASELLTLHLIRPFLVGSGVGGGLLGSLGGGGVGGILGALGGGGSGVGISDLLGLGRGISSFFTTTATGVSELATSILGVETATSLGLLSSGGLSAGALATAADLGATGIIAGGAGVAGPLAAAIPYIGIAIAVVGFLLTSGIFDNTPNPRAQVNFGLDDGILSETSRKFTGGLEGTQEGTDLANGINAAVTSIVNVLGEAFALNFADPGGLGAQFISSAKSGFHFKIGDEVFKGIVGTVLEQIAEGEGDFREVEIEGIIPFGKDEAGFIAAAKSFIGKFIETFSEQGVPETLATVLANTTAETMEEFLEDVNFAAIFDKLFELDLAPVSVFTAQLEALTEQFETARDRAEELGLSTEDLADRFGAFVANIGTQFDRALDLRLISLTSGDAVVQLLNLQAEFNQLLLDADALGRDPAQVVAVFNAELTNLVETLGDGVETLEEVTISASQWQSALDTLKDFRLDLLTGSLSPLSPEQQLSEARARFLDVSRRAQLGDFDAIRELPGVSRTFLEESKGFFASTNQFISDFNMVQDVLMKVETVAERHLKEAEKQTSLQTENNELLNDILEAARRIASGEQFGGFNPALNTLIAGVTGFTEDFGTGNFNRFAAERSTGLGQDLNLFAGKNAILSAITGFEGDFGNSSFQNFVRTIDPIRREVARQFLLSLGENPGFAVGGDLRVVGGGSDNSMISAMVGAGEVISFRNREQIAREQAHRDAVEEHLDRLVRTTAAAAEEMIAEMKQSRKELVDLRRAADREREA